jgi:phage shock protein C
MKAVVIRPAAHPVPSVRHFVARRWIAVEAALGLQTVRRNTEAAVSESDELEKLGELHRSGVLSDDEFSRAKARVLGGSAARSETPVANAVNGLRRSRDDRWLGGVCGGIARSTGIAAWLWRLALTALALCAGTGLVAYLLLWIFVPLEPERSVARQPAG